MCGGGVVVVVVVVVVGGGDGDGDGIVRLFVVSYRVLLPPYPFSLSLHTSQTSQPIAPLLSMSCNTNSRTSCGRPAAQASVSGDIPNAVIVSLRRDSCGCPRCLGLANLPNARVTALAI